MQQGRGTAMLTQEELEKSPLFTGITYEEYLRMIDCFQAVQKTFRPDDVIYDLTVPDSNAVGVLEHGTAAVVRIDEEGISTVLEELGPGGVFGRTLVYANSSRDSLEVICRHSPCDVVFIDYPHILSQCERACSHHSLLVQNMLQLMSAKAQSLSERVDVLSRRSIREKLLCYFHHLADKAGSNTFVLPFSLSVLAEYIATDRSAMMRELKHLREEGVIQSEGRRFILRE